MINGDYGIDKVVERCKAFEFNHKEISDTAMLYWRTWEHYTRFTPKPSDDARLLYNEVREREAYKMCDIRIQRIIDLWHEEHRKEKEIKQ